MALYRGEKRTIGDAMVIVNQKYGPAAWYNGNFIEKGCIVIENPII